MSKPNYRIRAAIDAATQAATRWHAHDGLCAERADERGCTSVRFIEQTIENVALVARVEALRPLVDRANRNNAQAVAVRELFREAIREIGGEHE